jgi:hypothetical protein
MTSKARFDRTLRVVMWLDAFLSFALAGVCIVASPVVAVLGLPHRVLTALGISSIVLCVLLAAFGAITAVAFGLRLREGVYAMPPALRLPLPAGMRPESPR